MLYEVRLPKPELDALRGLVGMRLDAVESDGCAAYLRLPGRTVLVQPEDAATPDAQHQYGDVERPMVIPEPYLGREAPAVLAACGRIVAVDVLSVLLTFTPPVPGGPVTLPAGGVIPAGIDYSLTYHHPRDKETLVTVLGPEHAVIDLDIGLDLRTERVPHVVLYTRGFFVCVSDGLPRSEEWVRDRAFSTRSLAADDD